MYCSCVLLKDQFILLTYLSLLQTLKMLVLFYTCETLPSMQYVVDFTFLTYFQAANFRKLLVSLIRA